MNGAWSLAATRTPRVFIVLDQVLRIPGKLGILPKRNLNVDPIELLPPVIEALLVGVPAEDVELQLIYGMFDLVTSVDAAMPLSPAGC